MHRNFVSVTSVLRHPSSYSRITWTRTNTQSNPNTSATHINVEKYRMTDTLAHTYSWCSRWLAITRTPSVNSHRLWCYYTLSSQRGSAISPLMTMIHSVWSDNSIYTPANDWEWKSERMIAAYVGATASMPTQSVHNTHTHKLYRSNHDCPYTLLCCPSVLWPLPKHWACHAYNPPSSGTLWERIPLHLVIPTSRPSYLSRQKTKIQTFNKAAFQMSLFVYSRSQVTHFFPPSLSPVSVLPTFH